MSIEIKVSLGEVYITTTQDEVSKAIEEARATIGEEYGFDFSRTCAYTIEGESNE